MNKYIRIPGQYCYIDESRKVVIPGTFVITEGLAPVLDENNLKWGFIDETCKVVIPCQWKSVGDFTEGLAALRMNMISGDSLTKRVRMLFHASGSGLCGS